MGTQGHALDIRGMKLGHCKMMNTGMFTDPLFLPHSVQSRSLFASPLRPDLTLPSTELSLGQSGSWSLEAKAEHGQERSNLLCLQEVGG